MLVFFLNQNIQKTFSLWLWMRIWQKVLQSSNSPYPLRQPIRVFPELSWSVISTDGNLITFTSQISTSRLLLLLLPFAFFFPLYLNPLDISNGNVPLTPLQLHFCFHTTFLQHATDCPCEQIWAVCQYERETEKNGWSGRAGGSVLCSV